MICFLIKYTALVSTHSRLKAAGASIPIMHLPVHCFNTQPPEGGWIYFIAVYFASVVFQHTAA